MFIKFKDKIINVDNINFIEHKTHLDGIKILRIHMLGGETLYFPYSKDDEDKLLGTITNFAYYHEL